MLDHCNNGMSLKFKCVKQIFWQYDFNQNIWNKLKKHWTAAEQNLQLQKICLP